MPRRTVPIPRPVQQPALRRCWSCNAVLTRHDRRCPRCGESVPFDRLGVCAAPANGGNAQA